MNTWLSLLFLVGLGALVAGVALIYAPAALIAGGAILMLGTWWLRREAFRAAREKH